MTQYQKELMVVGKQIAEDAIADILNELETSDTNRTADDQAIIDYLRGYEVEQDA